MPVVYSIGTGIPGSPPVTPGQADIILDPVQQLGYEQIPIWDGPTYLYTIHRLHFRGTYNPAHFAWNIAQVSPVQDYTGKYPTLAPNSLPPTTNNAIRHYLMHPRGTLIYNIGGVPRPGPGGTVVISNPPGIEALRSPTNVAGTNEVGSPFTYMTDCKNGPIPLHCNVVEVKGTKTWLVDWAIECYVNESYVFRISSTLSALLSQRWTVEEDLDQDFFATRTIVGHAIFRSDRLQALNAVADDFRAWLMNPVQDNFRRTVQQIVISEDGTRLDYVLVDKEQPVNLVPSVVGAGVTRIEAFFTQGYNLRDRTVEDAAGRGAINVLRAAEEGIPSINDPLKPLRAAFGLLRTEAELGFSMLPRYYQIYVIRVWGKRTSTRYALNSVAQYILRAKMASFTLALASGSVEATEDLMGKFIEVKATLKSGPIESTVRLAVNAFLGVSIIGPDALDGITQDGPSQQPLPPLNNGTRSNFYSAVTQVLTGADDTAPQTNNNRLAGSLTPTGSNFP